MESNRRTIDAIVLAGTREGYIPVSADEGNKCLLEIEGRAIVCLVIDALKESEWVGEIYIVGQRGELEEAIGDQCGEGVTFIEQGANLVENVLLGYEEKIAVNDDPYVLLISGDMPFLTAIEVSAFIRESSFRDYGCTVTFSPQSSLLPFEGYGIRLGCIYFKQFAGRIANMIIADPSSAKNFQYLRKMYSLRYQKRFSNYLRLVREVIRSDLNKPQIIWLSFLAHLMLKLDRWGMKTIAGALGGMIDVKVFEKAIGNIFGTSFCAHCLEESFGALDVDSGEDLLIFRNHYEEFRSFVEERMEKYSSLNGG